MELLLLGREESSYLREKTLRRQSLIFWDHFQAKYLIDQSWLLVQLMHYFISFLLLFLSRKHSCQVLQTIDMQHVVRIFQLAYLSATSPLF